MKSGGRAWLELVDAVLDGLNDVERVGAGLLADFEHDGGLPVQAGERARLLDAVLDVGDVADAHGRAAHGGRR